MPDRAPESSLLVFPYNFGPDARYPTRAAVFRAMEVGAVLYFYAPKDVVVAGNRAYYQTIRGAGYNTLGRDVSFERVSSAFVRAVRS